MPEGHTIHRLARDHQKWFAGLMTLDRSSPLEQGLEKRDERYNELAKKRLDN